MSKRQLNTFIVILGLAALYGFGLGYYHAALNYPQSSEYETYRYTVDKSSNVDATLVSQSNAKRAEYRLPCDEPNGQGESDLCAQWRAARAAEDSAFWAKWGFWIAVCGTAALLWQIKLTRIAVVDTGKATEAMNESNNITRKQMRRELMRVRPIVRIASGARIHSVEEPWISAMSKDDRNKSCAFSCIVENTGKSDCWVEGGWIKFEYIVHSTEDNKSTKYTSFKIGGNFPLSIGEFYEFNGLIFLIPYDIKEKLYRGEGFLKGYIVYRDNNTNVTFGATFGYQIDKAIGGLIAEKRTNEWNDWRDGIIHSVSLDKYGHIHFLN